MIPRVLVVGDSDPTSGAGIQADLKAIAAQSAYACTVLTVLTAQNSHGVTGAHPVPADFVRLQLETLAADVEFDSAKIGMLPNAEVAAVVRDFINDRPELPVVFDPITTANNGLVLVDDETLLVMTEIALRSDIMTPNLASAARLLADSEAETVDHMVQQARTLLDLGAKRVLIKGGHLDADATDIFADDRSFVPLTSRRVKTANLHGTGPSLAAAIAALYPENQDWAESVRDAKQWLTCALEHATTLNVGTGRGPLHHFYCWW